MKETKENTTNRRVYKILNYELEPWSECYGCPRVKNHGHGCTIRRCFTGWKKRSWKYYRNKQYKP